MYDAVQTPSASMWSAAPDTGRIHVPYGANAFGLHVVSGSGRSVECGISIDPLNRDKLACRFGHAKKKKEICTHSEVSKGLYFRMLCLHINVFGLVFYTRQLVLCSEF